jgi:hypothetical protein
MGRDIIICNGEQQRSIWYSDEKVQRKTTFEKNFEGVIKIPPFGHLDFELKLDLEFYARFLALYVTKLKRDWVKIDEDFSGKGAVKYHRDCKLKRIIKLDADSNKKLKKDEKHPEFFQP